jgi:hypothetical protein
VHLLWLAPFVVPAISHGSECHAIMHDIQRNVLSDPCSVVEVPAQVMQTNVSAPRTRSVDVKSVVSPLLHACLGSQATVRS